MLFFSKFEKLQYKVSSKNIYQINNGSNFSQNGEVKFVRL